MSLLERYGREELLGLLDHATPEEAEVLVAALEAELSEAWSGYFPGARAQQVPPDGDWRVWLILAGRGWGKTRTGAEWLKAQLLAHPGSEWAVVAPTYGDARDVCVEGRASGLLAVLPPGWVVTYNRSLGELQGVNGARVKMLSADEPDRARGWNFWGAWCDELAAWRHPATWSETLVPAVRLGPCPRFVVTTTPKPVPLIRNLVDQHRTQPDRVVLTRGRTRDNAPNLAPGVVEDLERIYAGSRLGRQELEGELLDDVDGALWQRAEIDAQRVGVHPDLVRVVVAVDPAVTSGEDSDETGIIVAGLGVDGDGYVLADRSCRLSPDAWARRAVAALHDHDGDRLIGETNNGGDLVETVLRAVDPRLPYRKVTASRGKRVRAEPVSALYDQGRVHHVGAMPELEDQLCAWTPESGTSPDRLDALVWALTDLMLEPEQRRGGLRYRSAA